MCCGGLSCKKRYGVRETTPFYWCFFDAFCQIKKGVYIKMSKNQKLSVWILTALVVGNMVGSGIFMLPHSLAKVASPAGVILTWVFTGIGVLFIALVFGNLSLRKPELSGGPQMYAKALFPDESEAGRVSGFLASWGYWVANFAGNVAIITTFAGTLSTFFPILNSRAVLATIGSFQLKVGNLLTFLVCTILLWGVHTLILKGVNGAGRVNFIATATKVAGFFLFIIITLFTFQSTHLLPFVAPKVIDHQSFGLLGQLNHAAVVTLWAFVGIESAVVFSARAKRGKDVKTATVLGLIVATIIYLGITVLVMGTLSQAQLLHSQKPLVDALAAVLGNSGSYILAGLGLISLFGSTIGWILLSSEVPFQSAAQGLFLKGFMKQNKAGAPSRSLTITNIMSQLFIFSTISNSISNAFDFVITVATLSYLFPYLIAAIYQLKLVITGETYQLQQRSRMIDGVIALLATLYSVWVVKAGTSDMKTFLLGIFFIAVGIIFYPLMEKRAKIKPVAQPAKSVD